jgi:hypothetical protein
MRGRGHCLADELLDGPAVLSGILPADEGYLEPLPFGGVRTRTQLPHVADAKQVTDLGSGETIIGQGMGDGVKMGLFKQHGPI